MLGEQDDWEMAMEEARRNRKGDEGRLESWVSAD